LFVEGAPMTESRTDLWTAGPGPETLETAPTATRSLERVPSHRAPEVLPADPVPPVDPVPPPAGATARRAPARTPRWLLAALAVVTVAGLVLGVTRCGAQHDAVQAPAPAPGAWTPDATIPPPAPGSLEAGTTSLFDAAKGDQGLIDLVGQTATGYAVRVQSVAADEGFWVGASATDRVWVQLTSNTESAITITEGQLLDLSGPVVSHGSDYAKKAGVTADEGADQLTHEAAHLEVNPSMVKVVGTR
jgi:hypothetical protein